MSDSCRIKGKGVCAKGNFHCIYIILLCGSYIFIQVTKKKPTGTAITVYSTSKSNIVLKNKVTRAEEAYEMV